MFKDMHSLVLQFGLQHNFQTSSTSDVKKFFSANPTNHDTA